MTATTLNDSAGRKKVEHFATFVELCNVFQFVDNVVSEHGLWTECFFFISACSDDFC